MVASKSLNRVSVSPKRLLAERLSRLVAASRSGAKAHSVGLRPVGPLSVSGQGGDGITHIKKVLPRSLPSSGEAPQSIARRLLRFFRRTARSKLSTRLGERSENRGQALPVEAGAGQLEAPAGRLH